MSSLTRNNGQPTHPDTLTWHWPCLGIIQSYGWRASGRALCDDLDSNQMVMMIWLNEMRGTWKKWNNYVGKLARQKDKFILLALQFEHIQEHVINLICDCVCFHFFFQELRSLDWNCILRCNFHFQKFRSIKPVPTLHLPPFWNRTSGKIRTMDLMMYLYKKNEVITI